MRTGTAPVLAQAFVEKQATDRMQTNELRSYAKRLNRIWSNVALTVYDESEAEQLLQGITADLAEEATKIDD